jgi:tRNA nucleotidyltransferase (CCA-adding enzyme)
MSHQEHQASTVLERLKALPGGAELLALAAERSEEVELVGGAVRDILLGRSPRELDVVAGNDARMLALALAERLRPSSQVTHHERFNTAVVRWDGGEVDVATRRAESYPAPGALPDVRAGAPEEDLRRRDFTVNAIALPLRGEPALRAAPHALEDLAARRLRVLHERSFLDDPTRVLRLARYRARLDFDVEPRTAELAERAVAGGALATVSGSRLGSEVRLALAEADPLPALAEMDRLGVFAAWEPGVCFYEPTARNALQVLPEDGDRKLLLCTALVVDLMDRMAEEDTEGSVWAFLHDLELPAGHAQRAFSAGIVANCAARWLDGAETTGEMLDLLDGAAVEGLALAAAMAELEWGPGCYTRRAVEDWIYKHRHIRLHITGEDLLAAGLPEGPEIGRRLERVFAMRMSGRLEEGREAELSAALSDD